MMWSDLPGSVLAADVVVRVARTTSLRPGVRVVDARAPGATPVEPGPARIAALARTASARANASELARRVDGSSSGRGAALVARFAAATADRVLPIVAFPPAPFSSLDDFCPFLFTQCADCE
jgi:hypothetical protein